MNFERIRPTIDIDRMQSSHVTMIGGAFGLAADLVRCGLGSITLIDFDSVDSSNPARQDLFPADIGRLKIEATANELRRINPDLDIETLAVDFCSLTPEQIDEILGQTDLVIDGTDFFPVHARLNQEVIRLGKSAMWIGLYRHGRAGEIIHCVPGLTTACYRCICINRYQAFDQGRTSVPSTGGTILDLHLVDAIGGQIAIGILTRGANNRMGRLIDQMGQRNLTQVKIDPDYTLGDKDIFAQYLGDHPANFSFTSIALTMDPEPDCPDCSSARSNLERDESHETHSQTHTHA